MPALEKPHHERFAQAVALGMSAAQAYRQHVARKNTSAASIETDGPALAGESQVALRIEELRGKVAEKAEKKFSMTRDKWLDELAAIASEARQSGDFSAASGALAHIGKASSYFEPEKHQLEVTVILGGNAEDSDSN